MADASCALIPATRRSANAVAPETCELLGSLSIQARYAGRQPGGAATPWASGARVKEPFDVHHHAFVGSFPDLASLVVRFNVELCVSVAGVHQSDE